MTAEAVFEPRSVNVRFVVEKVALGQVFLRVLSFPPVILFHHHPTFISINTLLLPEKQKGEAWGEFRKAKLFRKSEGVG
jgi:hypothetical protein